MSDRCPIERKETFLSQDSANWALKIIDWQITNGTRASTWAGMRAYVCRGYPHWHVGHPFRAARERDQASASA